MAENAARTGRLVRSFCDARLPEPGKARVQAAPWPPPAPVAIPAHDTPGGAALPAQAPPVAPLLLVYAEFRLRRTDQANEAADLLLPELLADARA